MEKRIYKAKDRMFMGVSGGLAKHLNMSIDLVRVLFIVSAILTSGITLVIYIVMGFILEDEPAEEDKKDIYGI